MCDAGEPLRGELDVLELEAHRQGDAPRRKRPNPQSRPVEEVVRRASVSGVADERLVAVTRDRAACTGEPVHGQHRGAEAELMGCVPARWPPKRVDARDAPARELDGKSAPVQRVVGEVPGPARAAAARRRRTSRARREQLPVTLRAGCRRASVRARASRPWAVLQLRCAAKSESGNRAHDQAPPHMLAVCRSGTRSRGSRSSSTATRSSGASRGRPPTGRASRRRSSLEGDGATGEGEDVTYEAELHDGVPDGLMLAGTWSLEDFSHRLDEFEELTEGFRRWAFESAALDLALRQNELGLGEAFGRRRSGPSASSSRLAPLRSAGSRSHPGSSSSSTPRRTGTAPLLQRLRELDRVRVVDLKAYYRGTSVDLAPDPELYRAIVEELPDVIDRGRVARGRPARGARRRGGPPELRRARPLAERPRRPADRAALAEHQAVALRNGARAARDDRGVRGARDLDVRRRPVRARAGPPPDPAARERLLSGRPERRRAVAPTTRASRATACRRARSAARGAGPLAQRPGRRTVTKV